MTHRQFVEWMAWLDLEKNRPDRTEHYLMEIAAEIRRGNVKRPADVKLEDFRLEFRPAPPPLSPEEAMARSKRIWLAAAGLRPDGSKVERPIQARGKRADNGRDGTV
jgi:hypothetical protein